MSHRALTSADHSSSQESRDSSKTFNEYEGQKTSKFDVSVDSDKETFKHGDSLKSDDVVEEEETSISSYVSSKKCLETYDHSTVSTCSADIMDTDLSEKESLKSKAEVQRNFVSESISSEKSSKMETLFKPNIEIYKEETSKDTKMGENLETSKDNLMTDVDAEICDAFSKCVIATQKENSSKFSFNSNVPEDELSSATVVQAKFPKSNTVEENKFFNVSKMTCEQENVSETTIQEYSFFIHKVKSFSLFKELEEFHSNRYDRKSTGANDLSGNKIIEVSQLDEVFLPTNKDKTEREISSSLTSRTSDSPLEKKEPKFNFSSVVTDSEISAEENSSISNSPKSQATSCYTVSDQKRTQIPWKYISSFLTFSEISKNSESETFADGIQRYKLPSTNLGLRFDSNTELSTQEGEFNESNQSISQNYSERQCIMTIIFLFEQLQKDLCEIKSFLDGTGRASSDPTNDPDYGLVLDEKLLAFITDDFGTGIESKTAQNTLSILFKLLRERQDGNQSAAEGTSDEQRNRLNVGQLEIPMESDKAVELKAQISGDITSNQESRNIENFICQFQLLKRIPILHPGLEAISNPRDVSRQLLRLNRFARRLLTECIKSMTKIISYCNTHSTRLFFKRLESLVNEILDVLQGLASLRRECSIFLGRCPNQEDSERVTYILKVKTQIAVGFNSLLKDLIKLTSQFHEDCESRSSEN